ncbi:MAG: hypothetical protein RIQ81_2363, partial [Pseudomonadota bacterium]
MKQKGRGEHLIFLKIHSEVGHQTRVTVRDFPVTIGRDPANQIVVPDDQVSRFHMRIKRRGRLLIVEDLESRNGTFINGDRVVNAVVRTGDKIRVGATEIVVFSTEAEISLEGGSQLKLRGADGPEITVNTTKAGEADPDLHQATRFPLHPDPSLSPLDKATTNAIFEAHGDMLVSRS